MTLRATAVAIASLIVAGTFAGCSDQTQDDKETASAVEGFDSPYCVTARKWAAHELNGGGDGAYARGGPTALEKRWNDQLAYLKISLGQAPPVIHDAEGIFERTIRTRLTPVLTKYRFDPRRVEAEGSAKEQSLVREPPPDVAKAQDARRVFQDRVCGYGGSLPRQT